MDGIHDAGGLSGLGPIDRSKEDQIFKADWEKRMMALTLGCTPQPGWNIDLARHARETIPAADYLRFAYYEKWHLQVAAMLVDAGVVTVEELASGKAETSAGQQPPPADAARARALIAKGYDPKVPRETPAVFAVGDRVRCRIGAVPHHTRMPRYVRGATGVIHADYGDHVIPDDAQRGRHSAEPLFCVAFRSADLFADAQNPNDAVYLDLWQRYLEPAA